MADAKDSFMVDVKPSKTPLTQISNKQHRSLFMIQNILRILVIVFSAVSIAVMVTNNQIVVIFTIPFEAHFYYSSSLKFLVAANGVICVFSVFTLIINFLLRSQVPHRKHYFFFLFVLDIVMTVLLISGCAAATAIGYVGQFGEKHVGWLPICNHVGKFCKTNMVSLFFSYLAFFSNFGLTILIAYNFILSSSKNESG
ncbi:hypothetical protein Lal_00012690 [Lupinus albus]|uniref:CASP-like protein n=1 Tax=Lupinus albus TaxID=3870 RepID=A0A6A5NKP8_LUPAL|nr:putative casparian strip membrane protein [Lupinus albus]KAF1883773.1 hypothetical protein Lal_00012690 [Lupinus albus]